MKMDKKQSKELGKEQGKKFCRQRKRGCSISSGRRSRSSSSSSSSENDVRADKKGKYKKAGPNIKHSNIVKNASQKNKPNKQESKKAKTIKSMSFDEVSSAGLKTINAPYTIPRRENVQLVEAQANRARIPEDITSIPQLQWCRIRLIETRGRGGTREILKPCRVLSREEAITQKRKINNIRSGEMNGKTRMIQYLTFPDVDKGLYKSIDDSALIPFGYTSKDGSSNTFNDDYLQRYMQQEEKTTNPSKLEATRLFLKRVFDHARDKEKKSRDQARMDLQDYYDDSSDGGDDKEIVSDSKRVQFEVKEDTDEGDNNEVDDLDVPYDDLDVPYTQAITFDPDDFGPVEDKSNEPIRPGDLIEYYSPIYVAGDARGLRQATVLAVDPKNEMPLTLSNGEGIPDNTKLKRIKVMLGGELVDHPGIFRPIYRFKLVKQGSATAAADAIAMEASRFGRIMHKNISKLKERARSAGFAPMDLLVNIKGAQAESPEKAPSRTISSAATASRGKHPESMLSSSDDSDNSSDDGYRKFKQKRKSQIEKARETGTRATKNNHDKENKGIALGEEERMSTRPLSSGSSLASSDDDPKKPTAKYTKNNSSFGWTERRAGRKKKSEVECEWPQRPATSDDSSTESNPERTISQREKFALFKEKKANGKDQDEAVTFCFSLSSDDETRNEKCKTPPKAHSSSTSDNSLNSENSLEIPSCSGLRKKRISQKSPPVLSLRRRLKLGTMAKTKLVASSPPPSVYDDNSSGKQPQVRTKPLPASSDNTSTSSKRSRRLWGKQEKAVAESSTRSSSDFVQTVTGKDSKPIEKQSTLSSAEPFSSDDSDDRSVIQSAHKLPTAIYMNNVSSVGWTKGKAGWRKKSEDGCGFSIGRNK